MESAAHTFFTATTDIDGSQSEQLQQTLAPEVKRKIIGDTFMRVADKVAPAPPTPCLTDLFSTCALCDSRRMMCCSVKARYAQTS